MLFGNPGLVDFTSWQSTPNGTFADPVQDALYDSGPRPLVVPGELWAEVSLCSTGAFPLSEQRISRSNCPQTAKRAGRD